MGPSHPLPPDDFMAHKELLKRVASNLGLQAEELAEQADSLFDILAPPVNKGVIKGSKGPVAKPVLFAAHIKEGFKEVLCARQRVRIPILPPTPGFIHSISGEQKDRRGQARATLENKDAKMLDLFGRKIYLTACL